MNPGCTAHNHATQSRDMTTCISFYHVTRKCNTLYITFIILFYRVITKELKILSHFIGWGVPVAVGIAAASSNVLGYDKCIQVNLR